MFKRVIWMGAGFGAGLGSSYWVKRAVGKRVERHVPAPVRTVVVAGTKSASNTVRTAVTEGRAAVRSFDARAGSSLPQSNSSTPPRRLRALPD